jgi:hypothetical protein
LFLSDATISLGSQDANQDSAHMDQPRATKASDKPDAISGLKSPTMFGRPNWDKIFDDVVAE